METQSLTLSVYLSEGGSCAKMYSIVRACSELISFRSRWSPSVVCRNEPFTRKSKAKGCECPIKVLMS